MHDRTGRNYHFDVEIEITDELSFVPGELGTYFTEALFELDQADLLFPGLKSPKPGERVLGVSFHQTGYTRRPGPWLEAPRGCVAANGNDEQRALSSSLQDAALRLTDLAQDQRLIRAKANALLEGLGSQPAWTKAQMTRAAELLAAIESVIDAHTAHLGPLL